MRSRVTYVPLTPRILPLGLLMFLNLLALHHHIIYVRLHVSPNLGLKHPRHHSLISGPCILKAKGHHIIMVVPIRGTKRNLLLIKQR